MTLRFLLDTSTVSAAIATVPDSMVVNRLTAGASECAIASVVWHELRFGSLRLPPGRRRTELEEFLKQVVEPGLVILPYDQTAAEWHAQERIRQAAFGTPTPYIDGQIAAIARVNNLTLVTANLKDFDGRFAGLEVESWNSV